MKSVYFVCILFTILTFCPEGKIAETTQHVKEVQEAEFEQLIHSFDYVLVVLLDPDNQGCGNECKLALEELDQVAQSNENRVELQAYQLRSVKVSQKYGVQAYNSILFFRKAYPILFDEELELDNLIIWVDQNIEVSTRTLNEDDFEHLTQAATGATTGDWFVLFYEPKCDWLLTSWETVASRLKHKMNVAKVDYAANTKLQDRFSITKCPTIKFFRLGKMYTFTMSDRSINNLMSFAKTWYKTVKPEKIPVTPTPFDALTDQMAQILKDTMDGPNGSYIVIALETCLGLIVLLIGYCMLCRGKKRAKFD